MFEKCTKPKLDCLTETDSTEEENDKNDKFDEDSIGCRWYPNDTTLYFNFDCNFDLCLQLDLAPELGTDLWESTDFGRKRLVGLNAAKTQLVLVKVLLM